MRFIFNVAAESRKFGRLMRSEHQWYSELAQQLSKADFQCDKYNAILVGFTDAIPENRIDSYPNSDGYLQFDIGVDHSFPNGIHRHLIIALSHSVSHFFPDNSEVLALHQVLKIAEQNLLPSET